MSIESIRKQFVSFIGFELAEANLQEFVYTFNDNPSAFDWEDGQLSILKEMAEQDTIPRNDRNGFFNIQLSGGVTSEQEIQRGDLVDDAEIYLNHLCIGLNFCMNFYRAIQDFSMKTEILLTMRNQSGKLNIARLFVTAENIEMNWILREFVSVP